MQHTTVEGPHHKADNFCAVRRLQQQRLVTNFHPGFAVCWRILKFCVSRAMQVRQTSGSWTCIILLVVSAISFCSYKAATAIAIPEAFKGSWCSPQSSSGDEYPLVGVATPGISADELYFSEAGVCQTRSIRWISHAHVASDDHVIISAVCNSAGSKHAVEIELAVSFSNQLQRRILFINPRLKGWTFKKMFVECSTYSRLGLSRTRSRSEFVSAGAYACGRGFRCIERAYTHRIHQFLDW
jgi:hypothetical protein